MDCSGIWVECDQEVWPGSCRWPRYGAESSHVSSWLRAHIAQSPAKETHTNKGTNAVNPVYLVLNTFEGASVCLMSVNRIQSEFLNWHFVKNEPTCAELTCLKGCLSYRILSLSPPFSPMALIASHRWISERLETDSHTHTHMLLLVHIPFALGSCRQDASCIIHVL